MNVADQDKSTISIPAYSKRQVMDWSLVLASQGIDTTILQLAPNAWALEVTPEDHERALASIRQYRLENRSWGWRQPIPWSEATFDWGVLGWCWVMILMHWLTVTYIPEFRVAARFSSTAAAHGEWWRAFTAILLHADVGHLLTNVTVGLVLLGLAMGRYGAGLALLATYLAGAAGNVAGLVLYTRPYHGLGASGMVMAALGLIAVPPAAHWSLRAGGLKRVVQAAGTGVLLFVLMGVSPASDVIAHAGGFVTGAAFGLALSFVPGGVLQSRTVRTVAWLVLVGLAVATCWLAAIR